MPIGTVLSNGTVIGERGKPVKRKWAIGISCKKCVMEIEGHPRASHIVCLYKVFSKEKILKFLDRVHPNHQCTKKKPKKVELIKIWLKYDEPFDERKNLEVME